MATIEDFKNNEFFNGVSDLDLKAIIPFCKNKTFQSGFTIFTQGERGKEIFLLLDGDVKLEIPTEREYGLSVVFVETGNVFGFSSLLEPYTYASTAKAFTEAKVIAIETKPFLSLISKENNTLGFLIMNNLAHILMHRLTTTRKKLGNLVSQIEMSIP